MRGALQGLRVLDLSRYIAGPYCGMLLGDLGADVVKVETPEKGENTREFHPRFGGESVYTMIFNRNKRGLTLGFRNPDGQELLRKLISTADIVIENFVPGTLEKMGCGWEDMRAVNPRLILTRISGFGSTGPYSGEPCFDLIGQAMSGLMDITGQPGGPPTMAGTFVADYATGLYAAIGTLGAVVSRGETGRGQLVEANLLNSALSLLVTAIPNQLLFGKTTTRNGNRDRFVAPSNTFPTADGSWIIFQASTDEKFAFLASAMGHPELAGDPRFATNAARMENVDALEEIVTGWTRRKTVDEVLAVMRAGKIPGTKVATIADVVSNPQVMHNNQVLWLEQAGGKVPMQGLALGLSETPMSLRHPAPSIGEHTGSVLSDWLGLDPTQVEELRAGKAI